MPNRARQVGASAIEVMIIVGIVLILAAILIPNVVQATQSYNIQIAANTLAQQLNRCRQEAVRANLPLKIQVSSTATSIDLNRNDDFTDDGDPTAIDAATVTAVTPTDGIVQYSSRGEMFEIGLSPEFRVTFGNRYRRVTVDQRGAVTIHAEQAS
jgi:Tfp pilus assembly protein FimT